MFDAIYDDGIDIMRIKVHCVRMENTSLEYFVSWMILYAWNIRWYRFRCSSFTISYTYRIFFGYLTFGIFLGYFMSRIFYCLYLLFMLKGFFFFLSFSFITSWNIIFFFVPLLFQIDFVKGPSLILCVSCYFYITMPKANGIFSNILEFRIHLLKKIPRI